MDMQLVEDAIQAVNEVLKTGARLRMLNDKRVRLVAEHTDYQPVFDMVCRKQVSRSQLFSILEACSEPGKLLVTRHVTEAVAEELRKAGLCFADTAGNVHLDVPGLFIFVIGRKPVSPMVSTVDMKGRMFQKAGLIFLFELMTRDFSLGNKTYRQLRDETGVSLGSIGWILSSLRENEFMLENRGERRLTDTKRLLEEWCTAYRQRLRPACQAGIYRGRPHKRVQNMELPEGARWGGETGAEILGAGLTAGFHTLYVEAAGRNRCIARGGLRKDPEGNVEMVTPFWQTGKENNWPQKTVHPLLIYADLITSGNSRSIEAGKKIHDRYLRDLFAVEGGE